MKRIRTITLLILASSLPHLQLHAQYYSDGTEAARTRWLSSRYGNINLIYPTDARPLAARYLAALRAADTLAGADYGMRNSRIDVVLHNHNVLSNGFVAWCPRRMELIAQPNPTDLDAQPWPEMLTLHEMRHVKQMYALRTGIIRGASVLLGEQSVGLAAGLVPQWMLEGDAVLAETKLSGSGRGRSAAFYQHYRTHLLTGQKHYNYDKWINGSYKHYIPNKYAIGYQLTNYIELKYGSKSIAEIMNYVGHRPFALPPTYWALRSLTGKSRAAICKDMFTHVDSVWRSTELAPLTPLTQLSPDTRIYTNYTHPHLLPDGRVIALKTSLSTTQEMVAIDTTTKRERVLARPGYMLGRPHICDSLIVWAEYRPHPRWEQVNHAQIVLLKHRTGQHITLPHRGQFSSPVALESGGVATICFNPNGQISALRLNIYGTSDTLYQFEAMHQPTELSAHADTLYTLVSTIQGKQLMRIWPGEPKILTPPLLADISSIVASDSGLFFTASYKYAEHIFFYNIFTNKTIRIVNSQFGSTNAKPAANGNIICSNYTPMGYSVVQTQTPENKPFDLSLLGTEVTRHQPMPWTADTTYEAPIIQRYRKLTNMLNVHSWMPLFVKPTEVMEGDFEAIKLGITALSQNLTGSTMLSAAYGYAPWASQHHIFNATLQYLGWWTALALSFDLEPFSAMRYSNGKTETTTTQQRSISLNAYIPINLTTGQTSIYIRPYSNLAYNNNQFYSREHNATRKGRFMQTNGLYISIQRSMSHRDLYPRWGWTMQAQHSYSLSPWSRMSSMAMLSSTIYTPGVLRNHSFRANIALQRQWPNGFYMSSRTGLPRGYTDRISEKLVGIKLNYAMPLLCPDLNIFSLLYIKRLSLNMFCDYTRTVEPIVRPNGIVLTNKELQSPGADLMIDFHAFRIGSPLRLTFTAAWPKGEGFYYDFGFSFSIN